MSKSHKAKAKSSSWYEASVKSIEAEEDDPERWQSRTWAFTRHVKSNYPKLSAEEIMDLVPWHETEFDEEDQIQFMREWNCVHFIPSVDPLTWALEMSQKNPVSAPKNSPYRQRFKSYEELLSIAAWAQVLVGEKNPIFLPTRRVAEMLGLRSNKTVATLCDAAVRDRVMELVEKHTQHRATRYRFRLELYPGLSKLVHPDYTE